MKTTHSTLAGTFGALVLALLFAPYSTAECGGARQPFPTHTNWHSQLGQANLVRAEYVAVGDDEAGIVDFWHVKFISDGISQGIPDGVPAGAEVDAGYSQWHSDGTEIMNSGGRAPNTGDFCLGVWAKVGPGQYKLNHFAAAWDPTKGTVGPAGPAGALIGPANIKEEVTLSADGKHFTGAFTIDQYDESGTKLVHLQGTVTGTRITVNTPPSSVF